MRIVVWWAGGLTFSRSCKNKLSRIFVILYLMIRCEISTNILDQNAIKVSHYYQDGTRGVRWFLKRFTKHSI